MHFFGNQLNRLFHHGDYGEDGRVRQSWAYGRWADAESFRSIPIIETMETMEGCFEDFGEP